MKKQPDVVPLLDLYQRLVQTEREKINKIQGLVQEREGMQEKVNALLDQNVRQQEQMVPKRPQTAAAVRPKQEFKTELFPEMFLGQVQPVNRGDDPTKCKLCKNRYLYKQLSDYGDIQFSFMSMNGNQHQQSLVSTYLTNSGLNLNDVYKDMLDHLSEIKAKQINPDHQDEYLNPNDSA